MGTPAQAVSIEVADGLVPYRAAVARMEAEVARIAAGEAPERIWFVEHPPVITAGTRADPGDLIEPQRFEVIPTGRGGGFTFHGPGQRIVYVMLDLRSRGRDVRALVRGIEGWVIAALAELGIRAGRHPLGTGVWVERGTGPQKLAAIGLRVRRLVSFHGCAINVAPDPDGFRAIVPCGIRAGGVARLVDLDPRLDMGALDAALRATVNTLLSAVPPKPGA
ncbi:lipoyl(octanoyl) transferase LipB [Thermaurantiacus sp.]